MISPPRMYRGSGQNAVTYYNCGAIDEARRNKMNVLVAVRGKDGKVRIEEREPRKVHRTNISGVYGDTHECAGEGKYIKRRAFDESPRVGSILTGAQHINPFLNSDGCEATIIEVFKRNIGIKCLSGLQAQLAHSRWGAHHLLWLGKRDWDGTLVASKWMTLDTLWAKAQSRNPAMVVALKVSKSKYSLLRKFEMVLEQLQRATCTVEMLSGISVYGGGCTPYAKPLEHCGWAIDWRWLTDRIEDGEEQGNYYFRLVIGRPEPHDLKKQMWWYEGPNSKIAILDDSVRATIKHRRTRRSA